MELTKIQAILDGKSVDLPEEWQGLQLQASFQNDSVQADIGTENFSFIGSAREQIEKHISAGYFFEGLPFTIKVDNGNRNYLAFEGLLNLQDSYTKIYSDRVEAQSQKLKGLNTLGEKLNGLTYGYLNSLGEIQSQETDYIVEKKANAVEIMMSSAMIYMMIKELAELTRKTSENILEAAQLVASGGLTSSFAGVVLLAGKITLDVAYGAIMVKAIIEIGEELLTQFLGIVRSANVVTYYELMSKAVKHLGYDFSSSIKELKKLHYYPSIPTERSADTNGVPRVNDAGYNCGEFFEIMQRMFSARVGIVGNTVHFENLDSNFWVKKSTWKMPDVLPERERKNGEELDGTRVLSFITDPLDEWSVGNFDKTILEIRTDQKNYKNGREYLTIKGVDDRVFPFALPNRKDNLNTLEKIIRDFASVVDEIVNTFGGSSNLSGRIKDRIGMLKIGTDTPSVPRVLYLEGGKLPGNHRDLFNVRTLYNNYIKAESFVLSKNGGQKVVYEGVKIPFGFDDFLKLVENSYFVNNNGALGKVTNIQWTIDGDYANIDYWIKDPNATDRLKETYIDG